MDRRLQTCSGVTRWLARFGVLALLLHTACSDGSTVVDASIPDADTAGDAGPARSDGGIFDAGPPGAANCSEPAADPVACCVGSPESRCCDGVPQISLDTRGCANGTPLSDCVGAPLRVFGVMEPTVEEGFVVAGPGPNFGGAALGSGFDSRGVNGTLSARVRVPEMRCRDECIDAVGVVFLDRVPEGFEQARIRFGVLVNGSRNRVQIYETGDVATTFNLATGVNEFIVRSRIDGTLEAEVPTPEGTRTYSARLSPDERLVPAVIGRTEDPGPEGFVSIESAWFDSATCDAPRAITADDAPARATLPSSRPAVFVAEGGQLSVFFANAGAIERVDREPAGTFGGPGVVLAPDANERFEDPWVVDVDGTIWLYAMHEDGSGERRLARVQSTSVAAFDRADVELLLRPSDVSGFADLRAPSVLARDGELLLYAQVELEDGREGIVELSSVDGGTTWSQTRSDLLREARPESLFAYDRDEITDPAVVRAGELYRLYYAARQGTRWRIAMMVSSDRQRWYDIGPVLGPDDQGYDAIGVRGPAPFVGADDRVSLYYWASDGVTGSLGLATP